MLKSKRFEIRLSEEEAEMLLKLEKDLKTNRSELVRQRVIYGNNAVFVDTKQLLATLDRIGAELGRCGNNINQLARHANILNKEGKLSAPLIADFNALFDEYIKLQREMEKTLRQLFRLIR
ncbi:plasmid mobilization protein [Desertivirga brevis]|uniref:plasmid mobilization protein n=1 Tax=Desertivirga brevis TaxID=2810310 RepID=UPI001A969ACD|nr:plasmid mobilization relaxosome protein MobC [Pedobacter sp. SYSU D00873]